MGALGAVSTDGDFSLLNQMPVGIAVFDLDGLIVHANDLYFRLVSCPRLPSDATGSTATWEGRHVSGRAMAAMEFPCRRALAGETVCPGIDLFHRSADGEGRWINLSAAPVVEPIGQEVVGVVLLAADADTRVRSVDATAQATDRFLHFAENSGNAVWIADAAIGRYDYRNSRFLSLTEGKSSSWSEVGAWLGLVVARDRAMVTDAYRQVAIGGTLTLEYEFSCGSAAKRVRETCFAIPERSGAVSMIGGQIEDITADDRGGIIYLVGEARGACRGLASRIEALGYHVKVFERMTQLVDAARFLAHGGVLVAADDKPAARFTLSSILCNPGFVLPVAILGCAAVGLDDIVELMRIGATDYLATPLTDVALAAALVRLTARRARNFAGGEAPSEEAPRLPRREREVLDGLLAGGTNKSIGRDLGISPRTVEVYRAHLMERMNVRNLAGLLQVATRYGLTGSV